ncbi:hypothetical protein P8452_48908 [Trifolium repens]|nr:hypothetical protein P8452_48908 [Trifolium repens]
MPIRTPPSPPQLSPPPKNADHCKSSQSPPQHKNLHSHRKHVQITTKATNHHDQAKDQIWKLSPTTTGNTATKPPYPETNPQHKYNKARLRNKATTHSLTKQKNNSRRKK